MLKKMNKKKRAEALEYINTDLSLEEKRVDEI
jgi:hypothetical protein